jgi:lipopolysaccharide biosynthesis glycosyltransferase
VRERDNFSIRFVSLHEHLQAHKELFYTSIHITIDAYSRFFIQEIFQNYDRVLYLDADLVANTDVAELFNMDLAGKLAAVSGDYAALCVNSKREKYTRKMLKISDPTNYFNSGVMLFNTKLMREQNIQSLLFKRLQEMKTPKHQDQDVLNSVLEHKTLRLSERWNYLSYTKQFLIRNADKVAPEVIDRINKIRVETEAIVHYACGRKPWRSPNQALAQYFWRYARMTPFYEHLLAGLIAGIHNEKKKLLRHTAKLKLYQILSKCGHKTKRLSYRIVELKEQIAFLKQM